MFQHLILPASIQLSFLPSMLPFISSIHSLKRWLSAHSKPDPLLGLQQTRDEPSREGFHLEGLMTEEGQLSCLSTPFLCHYLQEALGPVSLEYPKSCPCSSSVLPFPQLLPYMSLLLNSLPLLPPQGKGKPPSPFRLIPHFPHPSPLEFIPFCLLQPLALSLITPVMTTHVTVYLVFIFSATTPWLSH